MDIDGADHIGSVPPGSLCDTSGPAATAGTPGDPPVASCPDYLGGPVDDPAPPRALPVRGGGIMARRIDPRQQCLLIPEPRSDHEADLDFRVWDLLRSNNPDDSVDAFWTPARAAVALSEIWQTDYSEPFVDMSLRRLHARGAILSTIRHVKPSAIEPYSERVYYWSTGKREVEPSEGNGL